MDPECFAATLKHLRTFIPGTVRVAGVEQFAQSLRGWSCTLKGIGV